jgi:DNA-binding CsgD family transcriptional regulator
LTHIAPLAGLPLGGRRLTRASSETLPITGEPPKEIVMHASFGLTAAEARLAVWMASGTAPEAVAEELRITKETARNQLKAVFHKAGVNRQAELVALLASFLGSNSGTRHTNYNPNGGCHDRRFVPHTECGEQNSTAIRFGQKAEKLTPHSSAPKHLKPAHLWSRGRWPVNGYSDEESGGEHADHYLHLERWNDWGLGDGFGLVWRVVPDGTSNATIAGSGTETATVSTNQVGNVLTHDDANATLSVTNGATLSAFGGLSVSSVHEIDVTNGELLFGGGSQTIDKSTVNLGCPWR